MSNIGVVGWERCAAAFGSGGARQRALCATKRVCDAGFTLVETVVVIAMAVLLMTAALPMADDFLDSVRQREAAGRLHDALLLARSESIKTGARVVVCRSEDRASCATGPGGWERGWIVFRDTDNSAQVEGGESLLDSQGPASATLRMLVNQPFANYVSFRPDGRAAFRSGAFQAGSFTICRTGSRAAPARQLILSSSGRPRVERLTVSACESDPA